MTSARTAIGLPAERRFYGWGVASQPIDSAVIYSRDVSLGRMSDGSLDLALVDGIATLEQDLHTAFVTALGADPLNIAHGFDGLRIISEEHDFLMLRERLRGAVVQVLRSDPRVIDVSQVLIGQEIAAFAAGQTTAPPPTTSYGVVDIVASFRIVGGAATQLRFGPILAGA